MIFRILLHIVILNFGSEGRLPVSHLKSHMSACTTAAAAAAAGAHTSIIDTKYHVWQTQNFASICTITTVNCFLTCVIDIGNKLNAINTTKD